MSSINENNAIKTDKQKRGIWRTVVSILCVIAIFFAMFLHKVLSPRVLSQDELRLNRAIMFDVPRDIKAFELIDHNGEAYTNKSLEGKWSLIYFGFSQCPDICPTTLAKLSQMYKQLDPDEQNKTQVVLASVDPARDTPEVLKEYVAYFDPSFIGLTGEFRQIMTFTRSVNVAFNKVVQGDDYTIDHTGHLVLINPNGHYHGFFKPPFELAALKTTYRSIITQF